MLKSKRQINPEIVREAEEKRRTQMLYDEDEMSVLSPLLLLSNPFIGGTVSTTDSTGLIPVIPITPAQLEAYENLYNYHQNHPVGDSAE